MTVPEELREVREPSGPRELRVRLAADPESVAGARRFVEDGLRTWGRDGLVDDATLCVSELAGNATLHSSSTFMEVAMRPVGAAVSISVEDTGAVPVEAVVPRVELRSFEGDVDARLLEEATTGRGLAIVSMLADDWGVETTRGGKRVWAHLSEEGPTGSDPGTRPPATDLDVWPSQEEPVARGQLPEGWGLVRLLDCPVRLSLRQDEHLDELIRELQLIHGDRDNPRSQDLARRLAGLLSGPAHARHTGRRTAQRAAAAGLDAIDVEMAMPRLFAREVRALQVAVAAADELCEEMRLLTLASSPDVRALRAWMTEQVSSQLESDAEPVSWTAWVAALG